MGRKRREVQRVRELGGRVGAVLGGVGPGIVNGVGVGDGNEEMDMTRLIGGEENGDGDGEAGAEGRREVSRVIAGISCFVREYG